MQAENYRKKYGEITSENREEYIKWIVNRCKENLDKIGVDEYNVIEISEYAKRRFRAARFDEVEAEYKVSQILRKW